MGIPAAVVYSVVDRSSRAVRLADEAYCIGGPESKTSYLDGQKVIAVAKNAFAHDFITAEREGYAFMFRFSTVPVSSSKRSASVDLP